MKRPTLARTAIALSCRSAVLAISLRDLPWEEVHISGSVADGTRVAPILGQLLVFFPCSFALAAIAPPFAFTVAALEPNLDGLHGRKMGFARI